MLQPLKEEQIKIITAYQESGLRREQFCKEKNIKSYQLDYLINKQRKINEEKGTIKFIKLENVEKQTSKIKINIGKCTIDIDNEFNEELLARVIKVINNVKF